MAHIYDEVVSLISKEPSKRPDLEIEMLLPWFLSMSGLFKAQRTEVVKDILRNCEFRSVPPDLAIITQGERGDSFYIILSGSVSIYINQTLEEQGNVTRSKTSPCVLNGTAPSLDCNGNVISDDDVTADNVIESSQKRTSQTVLDRSSFGVHIRDLGPGKSFGELALVQTNSIRNASVISENATDLIVIDRELYNRSLKAAQKQEVQEKLDFVNSHTLYSNWTKRQRAVLTMSLIRNSYQYGNTIIRQGSPTNSLIFITKGQAKVTMNPVQLIHQYPSVCSSQDIDFGKRMRTNRIHRFKHRRRHLTSYPKIREKHGSHKHVSDVCIIGPPDYVGEFEVLLRLPTYIQTVTCVEKVETFELDFTSFTRLIAKKNPNTYNHMHQLAEMKLASRVERFKKEQIRNPVLPQLLQKFIDVNSPFRFKVHMTSDLESDGYVHYPPWYHYRDKQRRFLHHRRREKEIKEKQEMNFRKTQQLLLHRQIQNLSLISNDSAGNAHSDTDSEILPVISPDSRININPASGLVKLPRRMYSLDETSPRSTSIGPGEIKWQRPRSFSLALPTKTPLLRTKGSLPIDVDERENGMALPKADAYFPEVTFTEKPRKMSEPTVDLHNTNRALFLPQSRPITSTLALSDKTKYD
ncbi:uncharacterized protein [Apostichopus japonicus]|uniref:uncharacterized protein n=1 Tax=Stichopus japonicus TaxID=307972 RepID=UPI003AB8A36A